MSGISIKTDSTKKKITSKIDKANPLFFKLIIFKTTFSGNTFELNAAVAKTILQKQKQVVLVVVTQKRLF